MKQTPVVNAASLPPNQGAVFKYSGVQYAPAPGTVNLPLTTESGDPIPYMERGHVEVWVSTNGFATATALSRPAQFDFSANGTAIMLVAPSVIGQEYILRRVTPLSSYMSFADGAQLTAQQLNRLDKLNLYRDQEIYDGVASAGGGGPDGVSQVTGVAPISVASPTTTPVVSISPATPSNAGSMSAADKAKLDGITGGGGGTVTQVDGGAGLTGSVTTTGSLAVGAGTGITVAADAVSVDRTVVDTWYATAAQGTLAGSAVQSVVGTAPITATGTTTRTVGIAAASGGAPGSMSAADFNKLAGIANGATANSSDAQLRDRSTHTGTQLAATISDFNAAAAAAAPAANLSLANNTATTLDVLSSAGTDVTLPAATGTLAGLFTSAGFTKLSGIATGATANDTDANLKNRANHTGTQAGSTVTGLYTASGMTMNTARMLGRTSASTGAVEEITIGAGLLLSAGTLIATGGGGGGDPANAYLTTIFHAF